MFPLDKVLYTARTHTHGGREGSARSSDGRTAHAGALTVQSSLEQALEWSRQQLARGWELRAATDLAAYFIEQGEPARAHAMLKSVLEQFTEGFGTADLKRAATVLALAD